VTGPAVDVAGLHVTRGGREVLRGLDLQIRSAAVTGLLGPSGCGKTTLLRAIVGVQRVEGGRITVLGAAAGSASLRSRVAYMPQAPSVYLDLSVEENLRYFGRIVGARRGRLDEVLATVGLLPLRHQLVGSLSGGERARVSLATALLGDPALLVLDEPTVGLDPVLRGDLWAAFHDLAAAGATLLVSSHVMDEAAACDSLLLMREGAILANTTPGALRARTGEPDLGHAFLAVIREAA
jgi:ABC-2 type transport system ATP-binding protein